MKYPCPCCSYLTLDEVPPGTFEICPVCGWEDDNVQAADEDYEGGANTMSLRQARANFVRVGAVDDQHKARTRAPLPDEIPRRLPCLIDCRRRQRAQATSS